MPCTVVHGVQHESHVSRPTVHRQPQFNPKLFLPPSLRLVKGSGGEISWKDGLGKRMQMFHFSTVTCVYMLLLWRSDAARIPLVLDSDHSEATAPEIAVEEGKVLRLECYPHRETIACFLRSFQSIRSLCSVWTVVTTIHRASRCCSMVHGDCTI